MKKIFPFLLAIIVLLSLCSCGQNHIQVSESGNSKTRVSRPNKGTTDVTSTDATVFGSMEESISTTTSGTTVSPDTTTASLGATTTSDATIVSFNTTTTPDESQINSNSIYDSNGIEYIFYEGYLWVSSYGTCTQKNIIIPNRVNGKSVAGVDSCAFTANSTIESVTFDEGITIIKDGAFLSCTNLKTVNFPSTLKTLGMNAFSGCDITSMNLPEGLEYIGRSAFNGLKMAKLSIPKSVRTIEQAAFTGSALEEITIPGNVTLGKSVFKKCTKLTTVTLQDGITTIPSQAFYKCSALTTLNIPSSVTSIGSNAFYGCDKLTISQLTLNKNPGFDAFSNLKIKNLDIYVNLSQRSFLSANIQRLTIHKGVTSIGQDVFTRAYIGNVTFPSTLSEVKGSAFYGCYIDKAVFTSAVSLGHSAFHSSTIKEVTLPAGSKLGLYVFSNCKQLKTIRYGGTMQQWRTMIQIPAYGHNSSDYKELNNATIICSDGTISPQ